MRSKRINAYNSPCWRSLTPQGVVQEVYALLLAHYAVRALMLQAAEQAQLDPDRLSFTEAVFQVSETTRQLAQLRPVCTRLCASSSEHAWSPHACLPAAYAATHASSKSSTASTSANPTMLCRFLLSIRTITFLDFVILLM